ncbi:ferritin-like domain-containing protein [Nocardioides hwasunensis]|uniref:PA2169 family four-helix-bundle protein n=1 Tax=Nocardioides hwasunensis TaxID=397258 RepID=A0ABR8MDN2_9ACTN|nr:PA2169 family four-helix-bundle protein [Nocardioides hwasunensis]MBD3914231.1 PA2169 family four-helix-bundle protein [Nocardioides hwasunensis]
MSDDAKAAKELVETLKDGERGFADAAEKVRDGEHAEWGGTLERLSAQRAGFHREIVDLGHDYGDDVDESGSVAAAVHRGWISLKDALTGDDASAVLKAAVTGEDHTVSEYDKALEMNLSDGFRQVVSRQRGEVVAARDEVKALQAAS